MLKLQNVFKSFAGCFAPIINGLSLEIHKGEFCVIVGCNGSGKSTLLRAISGEYEIDDGKILIAEQDYTHTDRSQLIATVIQDVNKGIIPDMTLLENMVLGNLRSRAAKLSCYQKYAAAATTHLKQLELGLEHSLDKPLSNFSGGQRQMIATMMAIQSTPKLLLLDEHTSALDPKMQRLLLEYTVRMVNTHGITCLMVTHQLNDAIKYGDRLLMLHQGKIVIDVSGEQKAKLTVEELLCLFHKYEDLTLTNNYQNNT